MDTSFQSPVQKKNISVINDSGYNESNDQVYKVSDSKEQVDTSSRSNTDSAEQVDPSIYPRVDIHMTNGIQILLISQIPISLEPVVIGHDLVTSVRETLQESLLQESLKPFHTISLKEIVTGAAFMSAQVDRIVWTPSRDIHMTPRVNIEVFSQSRSSNSSFAEWLRNIEPLNTAIDGSPDQERNSTSFCINKIGVKSLPGEVVTDLDSRKQMNLASSVLGKSPKFI